MNSKPIPVIFDTDIGTDIDDMWALAMLLGCPELDLKLVVTACGDTTYRAVITAKFLHAIGRTDIPIGVGLADPKNEQYLLKFQEPWIEDYDSSEYTGFIYRDGIHAMLELIRESSEPVTIISVAATTNIARALDLEPTIAKKCRFVGMHGSIHYGLKGVPGRIPETNVRLDVSAFRKVLAAPWIEKIITPTDTCGVIELNDARYRKIMYAHTRVLDAVMANYEIWSKLVTWFKVDYFDKRTSPLFDTVAVYLAYCQDYLEMQPMKLSIEEDGMLVVGGEGHEILVAIRWRNQEKFLDHLVDRLLSS